MCEAPLATSESFGHESRSVVEACQVIFFQAIRERAWNLKASEKVGFRDLHSMRKPPKNSPKPQVDITPLVTAEEIGEPIGVTGRTVHNWAEAGKIPTALRIGKVVRFDPAAVAAALSINTTIPTPSVDHQ